MSLRTEVGQVAVKAIIGTELKCVRRTPSFL
jgi:hypothetical protein